MHTHKLEMYTIYDISLHNTDIIAIIPFVCIFRFIGVECEAEVMIWITMLYKKGLFPFKPTGRFF